VIDMAKAKAKSKKKKSRRKSSGPKVDPFQDATDRIIAMIESDGMVLWHKPWKGEDGLPTNLSTGKAYRGINLFTLAFTPYGSSYWVTFNQAKELAVKEARKAGRKIKKVVPEKGRSYYLDEETGEPFMGGIKKGEKKYGYSVFWKIRKGSRDVEGKNGETEKKSFAYPMLRFTPIFNVEQTTGIIVPKVERAVDFSPISECEKVLEAYKGGPTVSHGGGRAFYSPLTDSIKLPEPASFDDPIFYYSTMFHEQVHATGHKKRLARKTLTDTSYFGSHSYSEEELVAEMGASFLAALTGIDKPVLVKNSAAYLKHWLEQIKKDPKLLVYSAARAQKAVDFILGKEFKKEDGDEETAAEDAASIESEDENEERESAA